MEPTCEEARSEEPTRRGAGPIGRFGSQRGQEARQQGKRPQGWSGQKPQEDYCGQTQRSAAKARAPQERVNAAISSIHARFGECVIGLGYLGIRYVPAKPQPVL